MTQTDEARRCGALKTAIVRCCAKTDSVQFNVLMARRRSAARAGAPRFYEEYGATRELTLSASCPAAARLLLAHEGPAAPR